MSVVKWYGDKVSDLTRAAASQALHDGAEFILTESNKITPLDSGDLRANSFVSDDEKKLVATVNYSELYAVEVHEGGPKNWQEPGTTDKFLEKTAKEKQGDVVTMLSNALKGVFK